jgi:undecaprenyl-phosphate 4-deoxy-4-formamido-L-arabinose transferase
VAAAEPHRVSVVIPVYQGERTLAAVAAEVARFAEPTATPDGHVFLVTELLLVHDNGPDHSDETIRELAQRYPFVRPVWLSRNFGQHPATLAGMASSTGDWIVTMDEDGQHDPADMGAFLDVALRERAQVVYADPTNLPPHGVLRNTASRGAKWVFGKVLSQGASASFQSYRLLLGEVGRSVAAYAGAGVYLDVAIQWVARESASCPVELREEGGRASGYSLRRLLSHFWRLVLSSGTRGLRIVSGLGVLFSIVGVVVAVYLVVATATDATVPQGWTSAIVAQLIGTGLVLFSLGVIAEYIGVAVNMAMGKPIYVIVTDPQVGPLGRQ